jgi:hypothetical protein
VQRGDHIAMLLENCTTFMEICWAAQRSGIYFTAISRYLTADEQTRRHLIRVGFLVDALDTAFLLSMSTRRETPKPAALWLASLTALATAGDLAEIRVFHRDELMEPMHYAPTTKYLTEPQPGGWSVVVERWPSGPGRELTARRYMARAEREIFDKLNLVQQRRRLIDTVAAKDSVRKWLWDTYQTPSYPVEISLEDDGEQRYRASSRLIPEEHDLRVAVSGVDWLAAALLTDGHHGDIEARVIPDDADPRHVGQEAADAVASRNLHVPVEFVAPVTTLAPSRIEAVQIPRFAVAWTQHPAAGADPASAETGKE